MTYSLSSITKEIIINLKAYNKERNKITNYFKGSPQVPTKIFSDKHTENDDKKKEEESDDICEKNNIASYVNLFRVQLANGISRNVEFFTTVETLILMISLNKSFM